MQTQYQFRLTKEKMIYVGCETKNQKLLNSLCSLLVEFDLRERIQLQRSAKNIKCRLEENFY